MSNSIGDGICVAALSAAFLGYQYLKFRERQRRLDIIHAERLVAMEKDIPLPELPIEPLFVKTERPLDRHVPLIIGIVLAAFGIGTMIALWIVMGPRGYWPMPLPVAFIGGGLILYFLLTPQLDDRGY